LGIELSISETKVIADFIVHGIVGKYYNANDRGATGTQKNTGIFITRTVREILLEGYTEPIFGALAPAFGLDPKAPAMAAADTPGALTDAQITANRLSKEAPCSPDNNLDATAGYVTATTSTNKYPRDANFNAGAAFPGSKNYCAMVGRSQTKPAGQGVAKYDTGKGDLDKRNLLIGLDGSTKMEGKCQCANPLPPIGCCWDPNFQQLEPPAGGTNLAFPSPQTIADGWRYGNPSTKPTLDLIKEDWPPAAGATTSMELPTHTWAYISQVKRALKLSYQSDVKVPNTELTLRRFGVNLGEENVYWKSKADKAINAAGFKCLVDITEVAPANAFLSTPHLGHCNAAEMAASPQYRIPTFDTTTFDPGMLETSIDIEPHTGATMCASERLGAYVGVPSTLLKYFNGWACAPAAGGGQVWPATEATCTTAKTYIIPWYWARRHACITPKSAKDVLNNFNAAKNFMFSINLVLLIIGIILALVGIIGAVVLCVGGKGSGANVKP
jgi:hypothetical protein